MTTKRCCFLFAIAALFVLSLTTASAQEDQPTVRRCVNLGNTLDAPVEGAWGFVITEEDMQTLASAGFDSVRIPINWSAHTDEAEPYTIDETFFERIDEVIGWALDAGLQPIINIHNYDDIMIHPSQNHDRFMALWRQIATRYVDQPTSLIFELLNEPNNYLNDSRWNPLQLETLAMIREIDPTRTVMIGGSDYNSAWHLFTLELPDNHDHLIATFHDYDPFQFTHQGAEWVDGSTAWLGTTWGSKLDYQQMKMLFDTVAGWRDENGIPVLMGEFGAYSKGDMDSRVLWTRAMVEEAEKRDIGWCYWEFAAGFGFYDRNTQQFNPIYDALIPPTDGAS